MTNSNRQGILVAKLARMYRLDKTIFTRATLSPNIYRSYKFRNATELHQLENIENMFFNNIITIFLEPIATCEHYPSE